MSNSGLEINDVYKKWAESLNQKVEEETHNRNKRSHITTVLPHTIFMVPAVIRDANPDAYTPKAVSIGPYRRNDLRLQPMNHFKFLYLNKVLNRSATKLEDLLKSIQEVETDARSSYSESTDDIDSREFVEMMLLDGCFILELLLRGWYYDDDDDGFWDPIYCTAWALPLVHADLLMLENQIPFFVLERLFCLATHESVEESLIPRLIEVFGNVVSRQELVSPWKNPSSLPKFYHILHFIHSLVLPQDNQDFHHTFLYDKCVMRRRVGVRRRAHSMIRTVPRLRSSFSPESVPCARKLHESGVRLKKKASANNILDVTFKDGTLEIPYLPVYEETCIVFPNLIAFEQCFPKVGTHVTAYTTFMDCLVDTADDVALLQRHGCIVNGLGSDDTAANMFNLLGKGVAVDCDSSFLAPLFMDLAEHCNSRRNRWRAKLMHDYFSNPWSLLSLIGALLVIFLTTVQTTFAVLAYFTPPA